MQLTDKQTMAERYKVSPRTINNWVRYGIIPAIKIGAVLRFDPVACDAALARKATKL